MKIKYLGTAAYEAIPAPFCYCETCKKARVLKGKNIRSRSQALVNDDLLIDFPVDTMWHILAQGLDLSNTDNCLITHSHSDHLYTGDIPTLRPPYGHGRTKKLNFYSGKSGFDEISKMITHECLSDYATVSLVEKNTSFKVGRYEVTAIEANHSPTTSSVFYAIKADGKNMLYMHDSGMNLTDAAWNTLKKCGRFDFVSLDACFAFIKGNKDGHLGFDTDIEFLEKLKELSLADERTIVCVNHFSHNGGAIHDDMVEAMKKYNILVSYDGMEVVF